VGGGTLDPSLAKFSAATLHGEENRGLYWAAGPCCRLGMAVSAAGGGKWVWFGWLTLGKVEDVLVIFSFKNP